MQQQTQNVPGKVVHSWCTNGAQPQGIVPACSRLSYQYRVSINTKHS